MCDHGHTSLSIPWATAGHIPASLMGFFKASFAGSTHAQHRPSEADVEERKLRTLAQVMSHLQISFFNLNVPKFYDF